MSLLDDEDNNNDFNYIDDHNIHRSSIHDIHDDIYSTTSPSRISPASSSTTVSYPLTPLSSILSSSRRNRSFHSNVSEETNQGFVDLLVPKLSQCKIQDIPFSLTPLSRKELLIRTITRSMFNINRHYIPFKHVGFFPIGCTSSYAFGVIKQKSDGGFYPVVIQLNNNILRMPYNACTINNKFLSPWKKRLEGFDSYLGGCAFDSFVCVVTHESVIILNNEWVIQMLDNSINFEEVAFCVMNHEFLVIVGSIYGHRKMIIYQWYHHSRPIIQKSIKTTIYSVNLVLEGKDTLLFINMENNNGFSLVYRIKDVQQGELGSFIVLDESDDEDTDTDVLSVSGFQPTQSAPRWSLINCNKFTLSSEPTNIVFSKMTNDGTIVQVTKTGINSRLQNGSLYSFPEMSFSPIDVISYDEGIYVVHDTRNSLRFYDMFDSEITVVKSEDILSPMLTLKCHLPPLIKYYYNSLSLCSNNTTIAFLLTSGCLCFISP